MLVQAREMYDGARAEFEDGGLKAAASLAINAAIRASDCICTIELGYHSAATSHAAAIDVLRQVPDSEELVEALSSALSVKALFNYQHGPVDSQSVADIVADAAVLLSAAAQRIEDVDRDPIPLDRDAI